MTFPAALCEIKEKQPKGILPSLKKVQKRDKIIKLRQLYLWKWVIYSFACPNAAQFFDLLHLFKRSQGGRRQSDSEGEH